MHRHDGRSYALPDDLPFDAWIDDVFGRGSGPDSRLASDPSWEPEQDPSLAVLHITRLFQTCGSLRARFDAGTWGAGLLHLVDNGRSDYPFVFWEAEVPLQVRLAGLAAIHDVYAGLVARLLPAGASARDDRLGALGYVAYMWWDVFPVHARGDYADPEAVRATCLDVMERTLALPHRACQEGALHGLGHWRFAFPERVTSVIDGYLARRPRPHDELEAYARAARTGCIL